MRRRTFIVAALATVIVPVCAYTWYFFEKDPLIIPKELSRFCNFDQLLLIGKEYINKNSSENSKIILNEYLLMDRSGNKFKGNGKFELEKWLDNKIIRDFNSNNFVIIHGWVISRTEAQQCALLSIT